MAAYVSLQLHCPLLSLLPPALPLNCIACFTLSRLCSLPHSLPAAPATPGCLCCADASKQPAGQAEVDNASPASSDAFTAADESQEQGMHQRPTQPFGTEAGASKDQTDAHEPVEKDTSIAETQSGLGRAQHVQREALQPEQESLQGSREVLSEVRGAMWHTQQQEQGSGASQYPCQDSSHNQVQTGITGEAPVQEGYGSEGQPGGEGEVGSRSSEAGVPTSHQPQQQHSSLTGNTFCPLHLQCLCSGCADMIEGMPTCSSCWWFHLSP